MDCFSSPTCLLDASTQIPAHTDLDRNALLGLIKSHGRRGDLEKARKLHAEILLLNKGSLRSDIYISNALLSMFAKCGALDEAKGVFDALRRRNVVSWNTLISGYVHSGLYDEALNLFEKMQDLCFRPNAITFACILKACANTGSLHIGEAIHRELLKFGLLETNIVVGTALFNMYAKCGMIGKAREIFDKLTNKDVVSWNALIVGYIQQDLPYEALRCFVQMRDEKFSPNEATLVCVLKACGITGSYGMGEEIHAEILQKHLLEKNVELGNALVDMYAKWGKVDKSQEVFDKLCTRNAVTWNALISGYSQHGCGEEALRCFREMRGEGFSPDNFTFSCILKACGILRSLSMGEEIHVELRKQGVLEKDVVVCTSLMDMYAKCGVLSKVQEVFDEFLARNVISWNILIAAYAQHDRGYEALNVYKCMRDEGFSPNATTFSCILKVCGNIKALKIGEDVHKEVRKEGLLERNCFIGTALVDMYAKCGMLEKSQEVFDELPHHDVITWNALISGYSQQGRNAEAINCFMRMLDDDVDPNEVTFVCILSACANKKYLQLGEKIHKKMCERELLDKNVALSNALVDMYVKCCMLEKAREVFNELLVRNVVTWNVIIAGYVQHGHYDKALDCFRQMQDDGQSPNAVTFSSILKACGSVGSLQIGKAMHVEISQQGLLEKDVVLCTSLLDMYAKCGAIEKAQEVFDQLPVRNAASWTALMFGYSQAGKTKEVLNLLNKMMEEGIEPDVVTFVVVLSAYIHAGLMEDGQMVFDIISRLYHHMPTIEHYSCIVDLCSRAGHFDKAIAAIENVPASNRLPLWLSLLGACSKWANLTLGKLAFEQSISLDQKCNAAYVAMANIYVAAGMHAEAASLESLREESEASRTWSHHWLLDKAVVDNG